MKIDLGAYQYAELIPKDFGEQFTNGGEEPRTLALRLTTPMDELFFNRTVSAALSEDAQRALIKALQDNLDGKLL